jgi:hypothetical protein
MIKWAIRGALFWFIQRVAREYVGDWATDLTRKRRRR